MGYYLLLGANLFLLYCFILFFIDHPKLPESPYLLIRNLLLFCSALYLVYEVVMIYLLKKLTPENGILYRLFVFLKTSAFGFYSYIQPFQKEFITWTLVAIGLSFFGLLLVGIPGYLLLAIPHKLGLVKEIEGDSAWPSAIFVSMFWPLFFPVGVLVKHHLIKIGYAGFAFSGFIGTVVGGISVLVAITYWMAGRGKF